MNQQTLISQNDAKYKNARLSLLLIVLFSVVNVFSMTFGDTYFLFSAFLPQILVMVGLELTYEAGDNLYMIVAMVIAVISIVPYLLCWIFSKKRVGWMIAALVFFILDSLLFVESLIAMLSAGEFSFILDLLFRIWALGSIIMGVVYGVRAKKEAKEKKDAPVEEVQDEYISDIQRTITVVRKKSFVGSAVPIVCYVNGKAVCALKNGETQTFQIDERAVQMSGALSNGLGVGDIDIPAGTTNLTYEMVMKMGFSSNYVVFTPIQG
ncbi:MAG: hypothetical protein J6D19_02470 [Clostridia bacterium]|nr:hypothetical protein [Clostridia bacterium]